MSEIGPDSVEAIVDKRVRLLGSTGKHILVVRFSHDDPFLPAAVQRFGNAPTASA